MNSTKDLLLAHVRECFGKVAWSHKTQEIDASRCDRFHKRFVWLKILVSGVAAIVAVVAGGGYVKTEYDLYVKWTVAVLSSAVFVFDLIFKSRGFLEESHAHQATATKLWRIREKYFLLICELNGDVCDLERVKRQVDKIADQLKEIYDDAPRTTNGAYKEATKALHSGACSCTDEEIDRLLPESMRKHHD